MLAIRSASATSMCSLSASCKRRRRVHASAGDLGLRRFFLAPTEEHEAVALVAHRAVKIGHGKVLAVDAAEIGRATAAGKKAAGVAIEKESEREETEDHDQHSLRLAAKKGHHNRPVMMRARGRVDKLGMQSCAQQRQRIAKEMHLLKICAAALLTAGLLLSPARADSAFQARAVAEGVLSPHVKGKLIWVRSLIGTGVDHRRWSFLYFDPYADENGRLVVVRDGAVVKVDQGFVELDHLRMLSYKESEILPQSELKLDSDAALAAVLTAGQIQNVRLTTVHYKLEMSDENQVPIWSLTLFAELNHNEVEIGHARVSALTGQVFDLKIDHERL